ncbi:hypothetical protein OEZ85_003568 [Tetradesmus obliquus]|uniref:Phosphatidylglycerol lysyltransferase C-terminal domain-containing protein n=1 Tax=Tetradesmus obliquus TaxID=3088 RepID=A0ABY8UBP2_TETOB|nr:hypothetical protein OEZ85_003568 [Tetradesmus obliquus]
MLRCFTPGGCLGFPQADCEVQLNGAATEQPNGKKSDDFNGKAYCRDATPKRDQAKPAAQLPLHKLPPAPHDTLYPDILQHGRGILSLSTLQQGLQHFIVPGVGYIAYTMMRNGPDVFNVLSPLALGDPICDHSKFTVMAQAFLQQHPKAIFMQVSAEFAAVLQSCGLLVNSMGGETVLDLASYSFSGYAKRGLRSAIASAAKGVVVEEVMQAPPMLQAAGKGAAAAAATSGADWEQLASEMKEVDRLWLSRKGKHAGNFWFINRPPVFAPEPGVRKFTARDSSSGRLLGFIFFDAVFEAGQVVGYYANVTRMVPDAHPGVLNLLVSNFMDRVREESQLEAPQKKQSVRRSLRRKLEQQAAAAAAAGQAPTDSSEPAAPTAASSSSSSSSGGVRFLSLGLSPLHQMDDSRFEHSSKIRNIFEAAFERGAAFYPFESLAAAKAKYGAGLHDGRFEDPAVTYQQFYMAHSCRGAAGAVAMFDVAKTELV